MDKHTFKNSEQVWNDNYAEAKEFYKQLNAEAVDLEGGKIRVFNKKFSKLSYCFIYGIYLVNHKIKLIFKELTRF